MPGPKVVAMLTVLTYQTEPFFSKILGDVYLKNAFQPNSGQNDSYKSSNYMLLVSSQLTPTDLSKISTFFKMVSNFLRNL